MTDSFQETRRTLGEAPLFFFHGAHREFTARFIGLVRVFKGNRRTSEAPGHGFR